MNKRIPNGRGRLHALVWLVTATVAWAANAPAQTLDICGCEGNPASLGDFDSRDPSTYPPGTAYFSWRDFVEDGNGYNRDRINITLPEDGVLVFDSFYVATGETGTGARIFFSRNAANTGAKILVAGNFTLGRDGRIYLVGGNGTNATSTTAGQGGGGGVGGFAGGDGAFQFGDGSVRGGSGIGPGGGVGTTGNGSRGVFFGVPELRPLVGGAGGAGGASQGIDANCGGGGGGGGGGALLIAANGTMTLTGQIWANGGNAGGRVDSCGLPGGGGSGGALRLVADRITGNGALFAKGGKGSSASSDGSPGRIRLEAFNNGYGTGAVPAASRARAPGPIVNAIQPTVAITAIDGATTPEDPVGYLGRVDMVVPAPGLIQIDLQTTDVPGGTNVAVSVKPTVGGSDASDVVTLDPADCTAGVCTADITFDLLAGQYIVEARATFEVP